MNVKVLNLNETKFLVQHESCECKCRLMKMYVIQSKNGIIIDGNMNKKS